MPDTLTSTMAPSVAKPDADGLAATAVTRLQRAQRAVHAWYTRSKSVLPPGVQSCLQAAPHLLQRRRMLAAAAAAALLLLVFAARMGAGLPATGATGGLTVSGAAHAHAIGYPLSTSVLLPGALGKCDATTAS